MVELRDPQLTLQKLHGEERLEEHVRGERLAVLQAALLETMSEHKLRQCITFHHRTIEARAFAEGLPRVARRLHAADADRHPKAVWAGWASGEQDQEQRSETLRVFGSRAGRAVMSNCRVLGEGVDVPSVDSVALIDPKGSAVDIVQAIGRALRQKPDQGKLATLIVPIFLGENEKPEDMPYSASYRPLVKVHSGLRAHDERAVEMLVTPQENLMRTGPVPSWLGEAPEGDDEEQRVLLRFGTHRDPSLIAALIKYELIEPEHANWKAGHRAAVAYHRREGHLTVPYNHVEGAVDVAEAAWRGGGFRSAGGCPTSAVPCAPEPCPRSGPTIWKRWASCGSRPMRRGKRTWARPRRGSTCTGRSPRRSPRPSWTSRSASGWPMPARKMGSARIPCGRRVGGSCSPRSTPTGARPGPSTGNATTPP